MAHGEFWIKTEDWHTAGEPFRIVPGLPDNLSLPDVATVAQRRLHIISTPDHPLDLLRRSLCHEPRGHADMYGGFITPPDDAGAHFGVLFWHKDGFSTACGHGTIALGYWALRNGLVKPRAPDGKVDVVIDVPSGRVKASMTLEGGKPVHCDFINVPGHRLGGIEPLYLESLDRDIYIELSFAGAVYASVDVRQLGMKVKPREYEDFIRLAREIKAAVGRRHYIEDLYGLYGVIFYYEDPEKNAKSQYLHQRNVTIFADGQLDRSPCGSGTAARVALLHERELDVGEGKLIHESIVGSTFEAEVVSQESHGVGHGWTESVARVRGRANLVGRMEFFIDPTEELHPGFLLR